MNITFYICAVIAVISTIMVITRINIVHALLYFIVSLLAVGVIFFILGAPFVSALIIIINAGAIMVLFVFVIMMLNLGPQTAQEEKNRLNFKVWLGPAVLAAILIIELIYALTKEQTNNFEAVIVSAKVVGMSLFGTYLPMVELASVLLLAGLLGAYHLGRKVSDSQDVRKG